MWHSVTSRNRLPKHYRNSVQVLNVFHPTLLDPSFAPSSGSRRVSAPLRLCARPCLRRRPNIHRPSTWSRHSGNKPTIRRGVSRLGGCLLVMNPLPLHVISTVAVARKDGELRPAGDTDSTTGALAEHHQGLEHHRAPFFSVRCLMACFGHPRMHRKRYVSGGRH